MIRFTVNLQQVEFEEDAETPLLWVLRDSLGLKGSKFGCGIGLCGACTVHLDGKTARSCITPVRMVDGRSVTTIEGLAPSPETLHPVQSAWIEMDVPQCGYCQAGQIMAAAELLSLDSNPDDDVIDGHMSNICRCGTYVRIRKAIHYAAKLLAEAD